ncbi:glycosyltransferase family 4 protein [Oscillatoria sp. HE19RPO]|uniref:glycosyltransferase family 4 protein n=1 Tax=Oscillatoria sp. HE19RPO TaxID=2954806 RepID=UPI0020C27BE9|nr:glycosyltransferase [Oscillatoria sp. HE19RPO]
MTHRIWIINQFANTPDVPGHTRQYEFGIFLLKQGCKVKIFASDYNLGKREYLKLKFPQLWQKDDIQGLDWNWLYATPYKSNNWQRIVNMLSFCLNLFFIGLIKPKPDLIIGSSPQILAAFTAWILAKLRGAKFYFEVRDLWPQALIELGGKSPGSLQVRLLAWIESWLYRKSDRVIVIVAGWVNYVQERGALQVCWLPNGPDIDQFKITISPEEAKAQYQIESERFCLMYAGAHGTCNALETIVEAARLLEQSHPDKFVIVLVGDGPEKIKLMEQGTNIKSLEFRSPIPKTEISSLLQAADGLILTLKALPMFEYGVSPNKLYDYYAAGKPVLVSVGGAVNEEIQKHQIGLTCIPENAKSLANAIITLADMPLNERNAMGKRAEALVASAYSRKIVAQKLWNLIQEDL